LLAQLKKQGLGISALDSVFKAIVLNKIRLQELQLSKQRQAEMARYSDLSDQHTGRSGDARSV